MRILSPLTTLNTLHFISQKGILIKEGSVLEKLSQVDTIVFDKTGTLTLKQPVVQNIYSCNRVMEDDLLIYAASAEHRQTHPVAQALLAAAEERGLNLKEIEDSRYEVGYGIKVAIASHLVWVGSERLMQLEGISITKEMQEISQHCDSKGYSFIMVAIDGELSGGIELAPAIRPEAQAVINELRQRQIMTYIISGDQEGATKTLAEELRIDRYISEILPEAKSAIVEQLQKEGKTVCFVGDGINDSIALKKADISISLHGAATVATDTAQVVLMDGNLMQIVSLLDIAKQFKQKEKNNLLTTILPGVACIGGVFLFHSGLYASIILYLNPAIS